MKAGHALIFGISLVIAALIFGNFFYQARANEDAINVVGAATLSFDSDIVKWSITLSRHTGLTDVSDAYRKLQADVDLLKAQLAERGLEEPEITVQPMNSYPRYNNQGEVSGFNVVQSVYVVSPRITAVEDLALNPGALQSSGALLQNSNLEYFYSALSDIKLQLLGAAAEDARRRAEQIVASSGAKLGAPTSMRAGVFQITEPYSTEISDYGVYNTRSKRKDITVTVRASFRIE